MSNSSFRRELNAAFDRLAGPPSGSLHERVRASISAAPPARGGNYWIAAVAACVIGVLLVGVLMLANPLNRPPVSSGPLRSTATPSASAAPAESPGPSPTAASSPQSNLPPFVCTSSPAMTSASATAVDYVDAVRTGTHAGYDRLTIEFSGGQPSRIEVTIQSGTTFTKSPSGQNVTLLGRNGILVTIRGADLHTRYTGPADLKTGYPVLAEVAEVQDFEGVVQLALGVNGATCYRAFLLTNPSRLVVDVQASA